MSDILRRITDTINTSSYEAMSDTISVVGLRRLYQYRLLSLEAAMSVDPDAARPASAELDAMVEYIRATAWADAYTYLDYWSRLHAHAAPTC